MVDLGRCDVCISVANFQKSYGFYSKLGFYDIEGNQDEKWGVLGYLNLRLGLYEGYFPEQIMLNFRGGNPQRLIKHFKNKKFLILNPQVKSEEVGTFTIMDPDDYVVFFDTTAEERRERNNQPISSELDYTKFNSEIPYGLVDVCLDVSDINMSSNFYQTLGLTKIRGDEKQGWVILRYDNLRLALFSGIPLALTLNFRGGDIEKITHLLKSQKIQFEKEIVREENGSLGSTIQAPDKVNIYFNTSSSESSLLDYLK